MEEYKRFTVSLPQELYEKIEKYRTDLDITRSDAIRKAMYELLDKRFEEEGELSESTEVVGCITIVLTHEHIKVDDTEFTLIIMTTITISILNLTTNMTMT